ncbi:hypothetical protein JCM24511_08933 [Saitozyma sp. JCM 24511]|nr:hypothetical protein JCM24511_08933 [Saitozyma sp. JCM 24511]
MHVPRWASSVQSVVAVLNGPAGNSDTKQRAFPWGDAVGAGKGKCFVTDDAVGTGRSKCFATDKTLRCAGIQEGLIATHSRSPPPLASQQ